MPCGLVYVLAASTVSVNLSTKSRSKDIDFSVHCVYSRFACTPSNNRLHSFKLLSENAKKALTNA